MNVIVIAPHPDDEAIGCGGAICLHAQRGDRVTAVFLTSGELGLKHLPAKGACKIREAEAQSSAKFLGIAELFFLRQPDWVLRSVLRKAATALTPILRQVQPALIYLPHLKEWHPDHQASWPLLQSALAKASIPRPQLYGYEVWTPLQDYDHVQDISRVMTRKLKAVRAHRSQLGELNYVQAVRGLNQYRGEMAGKCRFAEVFKEIDL